MARRSKRKVADLDQLRHPAVDSGSGTRIPFTRISAIAPFSAFLDEIGAPTGRLLCQARIPAAVFEEPEALVPLHLAHRLGELAARSERIEDLGCVVAQRTSAFDLGVLGVSLQRASTVCEYLRTGIRAIGSVSSGERFWLSAEGDRLRFNQYLPGIASPGRCQADVYTLVLTIKMLRQFADPCWSPDEVRLLAGGEGLLGDRRFFGGARIITGEPYSSFTMQSSLLQRPIPRSVTPKVHPGKFPQGIGPPIPEGFRDAVEWLTLTLLLDGYPDIHFAAEVAGMSVRTLQRRLADIGLTYSQLLTETRMRLAAERLTDSDMSIAEIADSLGYTDAANFARAFRRQTGMSPRSFRQVAAANS